MITYDKLTRIALDEATDFLIHRFPFINSVDLVLQMGSGQSPENILDHVWDRAPLHEMPHLPTEESLAKHKLEIIWGTTGPFKILIYAGRFHVYEGYGRIPCILPIWAASKCGARHFLFTNAAISLNSDMEPGSFMLLNDHINNLGISPLGGHQHLLESSYVDMTETYSPEWAESFLKATSREKMVIHEGVYMANLGPQFETPAEIQLARLSGADALGMSTVLETITAHALKAKVLGISMIMNTVLGAKKSKVSHEEAFNIGKTGNKLLTAAIRRWLLEEGDTII